MKLLRWALLATFLFVSACGVIALKYHSNFGPGHPPAIPTGKILETADLKLQDNQTFSSTCHTSVGATCALLFSRDDETTINTIPRPVDRRGYVTIRWNVKNISLQTGKWQVQFVAGPLHPERYTGAEGGQSFGKTQPLLVVD